MRLLALSVRWKMTLERCAESLSQRLVQENPRINGTRLGSIFPNTAVVYTGLLAVLLVAFGSFLYGAVEQLAIRSVEITFTPRFEQAMKRLYSHGSINHMVK